MRRRKFIFLALQGGWLAHANAQSRDSSQPLIAVLSAGSESSTRPYLQAFRNSMSRLGYVDGRAARFEYRFADGYLDRLPKLAAELVLLNPTIIVSAPLPANLAVAKLTSTIPIVMSSGADPVGNGLVKSLSRPGGNVTGVANFADGLPSKQVEVLKELFPNARRLGI